MKSLALLLFITAPVSAEDLMPPIFPKDRYAETVKKSPFVLETKVIEQPVAPVNPFQNLYLRSVSKADGKDYVLIQRLGDERPMKPFIGNDPGPDEFTVKSVRMGDNFRQTKVVLQKGAEVGEIGFKEDTINAPPAMPAAARNPGMPGNVSKPGGIVLPQPPGSRPPAPVPSQVIPRPTSIAAPAPSQPIKLPEPSGTPTRTRIRTINN